jgi:hypothetical protein
MDLKFSRIRLVVGLVGLVMLAAYLAWGGSFGRTSNIAIEFGINPREFDGLAVEIDGKPAGKLRASGQETRTTFRVSKGEHTVRVLHPTYPSVVRTVTTGGADGPAFLAVGFAEMAAADGRPEIVVTFR